MTRAKLSGVLFSLLLVLSGPHASAKQAPICPHDESDVTRLSSSPQRLASDWKTMFERLFAATPKLSPRERAWLEEELKGSGDRYRAAAASVEQSIQDVGFNVGSLFEASRQLANLPEGMNGSSRAQRWTFIAYTLIEPDSSWHLARLIKAGRISESSLPAPWRNWHRMFADDPVDGLNAARVQLARHILICIVPLELQRGDG